jgi:hypothetical protein
MTITLAYKNSTEHARYQLQESNRERRSALMAARLKRPSSNERIIKVGQQVEYEGESGVVAAINISCLGRWPGHIYPYVVILDCGLVVRCNNLDLRIP